MNRELGQTQNGLLLRIEGAVLKTMGRDGGRQMGNINRWSWLP